MILSDPSPFTQRFSVLKISKKTASSAYLYHGEDMLEIMQAKSVAESTGSQDDVDAMELVSSRIGLNHFGFRTRDIKQSLEEFEELRKEYGGKMLVPLC